MSSRDSHENHGHGHDHHHGHHGHHGHGHSHGDGPASFNAEEFPHGPNAPFLRGAEAADELEAMFGGGTGRFENPELRDIAAHRGQVVEELQRQGLGPGSHLLDLGAGTGLFLEPLAKIVGSTGQVFAAEISEGFCALLERRRAADETLAAASQVVHIPEDAITLPDDSVEFVLICDVYHHLTFPTKTLKECLRVLKPKGKLILIDFHRDDACIHTKPAGWVEKHVRADQDTFRAEVIDAGFALLSEPDLGMKENYVMIFEAIDN